MINIIAVLQFMPPIYIDYHKSNTALQFDAYFKLQIHLYTGRGKYTG